MKTTTACTLLLAIGLFVSCNQASQKSEDLISNLNVSSEPAEQKNKISETEFEDQQVPVADSVQQAPSPAAPSAPAAPVPNIDWDKKIIKTGTVKYEVKNFDQFNKEVREKVRKYGGYIAQEDNLQFDDRKEISLVIKVPVAQFEPALNDLQNKDAKQVERTIKTEDVTGQVVDTKSRLEAKRQMRLKYLEFLKQSKNMEEVLKVQSEINGIQEEMEAAQGRIQYLGNQSAYSTINLNFYQPFENFKAPAPDDNSFFKKTGEAFGRGADLVKGLVLVIISIWPLILILVAAWLIWRRKRGVQQPAATK
ncbi:MAG: DUF4349 domain-containing protein [Ferruginibacter sp.]